MRKQGFSIVKSGGIVACVYGALSSVLVAVVLLVICAAGIMNGMLELGSDTDGMAMIHLLSSACGVAVSQKLFKKDKILAAFVVGTYCVLVVLVAVTLFGGATKLFYLTTSVSAIGGLLGYFADILQWKSRKRYRQRR